jgi:hypothetical protein
MKPATGEELKEIGMQLALERAGHVWADDMMEKLKAFCKARRDMGLIGPFRFEQFREVAEKSGWTLPPDHHAWGNIPRLAIKRGIICATGQFQLAQSPKTRSHPVRTYYAC